MKRRGFTILEILLAIFVLTMGALSVTQLFPLELRIGQSAKNRTLAAHLAQAVLEEMTSIPYGELAEGAYSSPAIPDSPDDPFTVTATVACVDANIATIDCDDDVGLKRGDVILSWRNRPEHPQNEFRIGTLFTNN